MALSGTARTFLLDYADTPLLHGISTWIERVVFSENQWEASSCDEVSLGTIVHWFQFGFGYFYSTFEYFWTESCSHRQGSVQNVNQKGWEGNTKAGVSQESSFVRLGETIEGPSGPSSTQRLPYQGVHISILAYQAPLPHRIQHLGLWSCHEAVLFANKMRMKMEITSKVPRRRMKTQRLFNRGDWKGRLKGRLRRLRGGISSFKNHFGRTWSQIKITNPPVQVVNFPIWGSLPLKNK